MLISPVPGAPHAYFQMVLVKLCMVFNDGIGKDIIISDKIWKQHIFRHAKYPNLTVKLPKQGSKFYSRLEKKGLYHRVYLLTSNMGWPRGNITRQFFLMYRSTNVAFKDANILNIWELKVNFHTSRTSGSKTNRVTPQLQFRISWLVWFYPTSSNGFDFILNFHRVNELTRLLWSWNICYVIKKHWLTYSFS